MDTPLWVWGVVLCVVCNGVTSLGLVLQKLSHVRNDALSAAEQRAYYLQPVWWAGFSIFLGGQVGHLVSMGLAPLTVLSCLNGVAIVLNLLFSALLLGERLPLAAAPYVLGVALGGALLVACGPSGHEPGWVVGNAEPLLGAFARPLGAAWAAGSLLLAAALLLLESPEDAPERAALRFVALASLSSGWSCLCFRGCALMLVAPDPHLAHVWSAPAAWVLLAVGAAAGVAYVRCLNAGLQLGQAVVVVPASYALGMVSCLLAGALYFDELSRFVVAAPLRAALFGTGVLVSLWSVMQLGSVEAGEARKPADPEKAVAPRPKRSAKTVPPTERTPILDEEPRSRAWTSFVAGEERVYSYDPNAFKASYPRGRTYTVGIFGPGFA